MLFCSFLFSVHLCGLITMREKYSIHLCPTLTMFLSFCIVLPYVVCLLWEQVFFLVISAFLVQFRPSGLGLGWNGWSIKGTVMLVSCPTVNSLFVCMLV